MPLPVTITGIALGAPDSTPATCGPYKSSGGKFYFFGCDSSVATTLQAYKATAPATAWSSIATTTGFSTALHRILGFQVGDVIHLALSDGGGGTANIKYLTFDMSSDTFGTVETIEAGFVNFNSSFNPIFDASIVVRSNGNVVIIYQKSITSPSNTIHLYWTERTGVNTWSAGAIVDDGNTANNYTIPEAVLASLDRVHFHWTDGGTTVSERSLDNSNTLDTRQDIAVSGATLAMQGVITPNGNIFVVASNGGNHNGVYYSSGANPTLSTWSTGNNLSTPAISFIYNSVIWVIYRDQATGDLAAKRSFDSGATFDAPRIIHTGTVAGAANNLSFDGSVYERPSNHFVLPYLVNDNSTLMYDEFEISNIPQPLLVPMLGAGNPSSMTLTATRLIMDS